MGGDCGLGALILLSAALAAGCAGLPDRPAGRAHAVSIHEAAGQGDLEAVKGFLRRGVPVDLPDGLTYSSKTALHYAAEGGHLSVIELLLAKGADIWRRDALPAIPIEYALRSSTGPAAARLFAAATRRDPDALGTVFQAAVIWGLPELVRSGLAAGADIHRRDFRGLPPINAAFSVLPESANRARLILERRLGLSLGEWPLAGVRTEIVSVLLANGADPNSTGRSWSAAKQAVSNGGLEELKLLVKHGARLTPELLDWAASSARPAMLEYLLSEGLAADATGTFALHVAAGGSDFESVRVLLAAGADPARLDAGGTRPLDKARSRLGYSRGTPADLNLFARMSLVLPDVSGVTDGDLMKAVLERFGAPPLSPVQRDAVGKVLRSVHSRFRGPLRDSLRQDRDAKAKARFEAALQGDKELNWAFYYGPAKELSEALGDRGSALPLKPLAPDISAFAPRSASVLRVPEILFKAAYVSPLRFYPAFEVFSDTRSQAWGEGKTLGAVWRHDLPFESKLRGLAVGADRRGHFIESPDRGGGAWLRGLSALGVVVSSASVGLDARELGAARLAGDAACAYLDIERLLVSKGASVSSAAVGGRVDGFVFSDFGDGGTLVAHERDAGGRLLALNGDGKALWSYPDGEAGPPRAFAAGRLPGRKADSLLVLVNRDRRNEAVLLDAEGRVEGRHLFDGWHRIFRLADLDGSGARAVTVQSFGGGKRDRLQVWDVAASTWTLRAEAELGWADVESIAFPDFDGDGTREIVLGAKNGWLLVFSRAAELLSEFKFVSGVSRLAAGDLNGDRADELLVGLDTFPPQIFGVAVGPDPGPKLKVKRRAASGPRPAPR